MGAREAFESNLLALDERLWRELFAPPVALTVTEWAEQNRYLTSKDSAEPGTYRISRTPYCQLPQDLLSQTSTAEIIVLMWPAQVGKSTIGLNWLGYNIDVNPGPMLVVQPTVDLAKTYSRQRVAPMIVDSPNLAAKVNENVSRDESNTMLMKEYAGGFVKFGGANSAAGLRQMSIRDLHLDEIDNYPEDVDGEGDPVMLAFGRQTTFSRGKVLLTSTPLVKGQSRVESWMEKSDKNHQHVPCPHCGEYQHLQWENMTWQKDDQGAPITGTERYVCKHCGTEIEERYKSQMLAAARWIPERPELSNGPIRGFYLNGLYSPLGWFPWRKMVAEFYDAQQDEKNNDMRKMQNFWNNRLARTWEIKGEGGDAQTLRERAEDYKPGIVPHGGLMLVIGTDTQPDRLEARIWAYGREQESWLISRHIIYGDPNIDEGKPGSPWDALTELRQTPVAHASGAKLMIEGVAIDSGGHNTHAVYAYARKHAKDKVIAIRGASTRGRPIIGKPTLLDFNQNGKIITRGAKIYTLGSDTIRDRLYPRLRITNPGPAYVHLPSAYSATDEFEQMTAPRKMPRKMPRGRVMMVWEDPPGKRVEAADCWFYAFAMAVHLGVESITQEGWNRREAALKPEAVVKPKTKISLERFDNYAQNARWKS